MWICLSHTVQWKNTCGWNKCSCPSFAAFPPQHNGITRMLTTTVTNRSQSTHSRRHVGPVINNDKQTNVDGAGQLLPGGGSREALCVCQTSGILCICCFSYIHRLEKTPPKNTANKLHCSCSAWDHIHVATSGVHSSFKRVRCISCCHKCSICTTAGSTAILAGVKQEVRGIGVVHHLPLGSCSGCNRLQRLLISHRALQQMPDLLCRQQQLVRDC